MNISALSTDFYELTMMQGYFSNHHNPEVVFDMFYRTNPFNGGYALFTGLNDLLEKLEGFSFSASDIEYLRSLNKFTDDFLDYLSTYRFTGTIWAMDEGQVVFPGEPLIRVHTNLIEAQLIETFLLNTVNFQTLIATKAARVSQAAHGGLVMEFGFRRAQGMDGAISATRASYIGGCQVTSNTIAGKMYNIPVAGTMAHSWVMSFNSELESFRAFAKLYPDNAILLIDTYDTLGSGIENAIIVGHEQKKLGKKIGVRIDSGDLSYLSRQIRTRLDEAGLEDATICVSNDLTEEIIKNLVDDGVPIDSWGVGTHLATGGSQASLNGVYKLAWKRDEEGQGVPTMKISNSYEKTTNPGIKQVYRFFDEENGALGDLIALDDEEIRFGDDFRFNHPFARAEFFTLKAGRYDRIVPLLSKKMDKGRVLNLQKDLSQIQKFAKESLMQFHRSYKRQINPHIYKISLSNRLRELKTELMIQRKDV